MLIKKKNQVTSLYLSQSLATEYTFPDPSEFIHFTPWGSKGPALPGAQTILNLYKLGVC